MINDPATTLLCCNKDVLLALIQISGLKKEGRSVQSIALTSLWLPTTRVTIQVLKLTPRKPTESDTSDWTCDTSMAYMDKENSLLEVSRSLIEVVNPVIVPSEADIPVFHFATNELLGITALLHQRILDNNTINIPTVKVTADFPYRVEGMLPQFC
jgi:hypothetical protein